MREPEVGAPTDSDAPTSSVLPRQSIRLLVPLPASLVMTTLAPLEEHTTARAGMLVAGPPLLAHMASWVIEQNADLLREKLASESA